LSIPDEGYVKWYILKPVKESLKIPKGLIRIGKSKDRKQSGKTKRTL
jgi:hypothetical protein